MTRPNPFATSGAPKALLALAAAAALSAALAHSAAQDLLWIEQFGSAEDDRAMGIAADGSGGVLLAGSTRGSLGGPNSGDSDAWLARHDSAGNQLWIVQLGTSEWEIARAVADAGAGEFWAAGVTSGSLGGPHHGGNDAWLARFDDAGNQLWITQFGTAADDTVMGLAEDAAGGVFIGGYTHGDLGGKNAGMSDVWIARHDAAGLQLWLVQFGTSKFEQARGLFPDGDGGVFLTGWTAGDLGGKSHGLADGWLARFDAAGNQVLIVQFGTSAADIAHGVATDGAGGAFVAGSTEGAFGGPNKGDADAWLARFDPSGNSLWTLQFGTGTWDEARTLAPDGAGGVFIAGSTWGSLGWPNPGFTDPWLAHCDQDGNTIWLTQFGTKAHDEAMALAPAGAGGIFVAGFTKGSLGAPNNGLDDAWLGRIAAVACYADMNDDGLLNLFDFLGFVNLFNDDDAAADCDASGALNLFDFFCFTNLFNQGC